MNHYDEEKNVVNLSGHSVVEPIHTDDDRDADYDDMGADAGKGDGKNGAAPSPENQKKAKIALVVIGILVALVAGFFAYVKFVVMARDAGKAPMAPLAAQQSGDVQPAPQQPVPSAAVPVTPAQQSGDVQPAPQQPVPSAAVPVIPDATQPAAQPSTVERVPGMNALAQREDETARKAAEDKAAALSERFDAIDSKLSQIISSLDDLKRSQSQPAPRAPGMKSSGVKKHLPTHASNTETSSGDVKNLTLQAVIAGQAWIIDAQGKIHAVRSGDSLPDGTRIVAIDPDSGVVKTNRGNLKVE